MSPSPVELQLVVLRHAKSDWSGNEADIDRPLAKRGMRQAPEAGQWLAANVEGIDLAIVSPAQRTRSTWELVAAELDEVPKVRVDDRVYGASAGQLVGVLHELGDDVGTVVLVGHNPTVEDLVERLTGELVAMPTSAIAVISGWSSWARVGDEPAVLRTLGRPPP